MSLHRKYGELFPGQRQIGQLATSADEKSETFLIWVLPGDTTPKWVTEFTGGQITCATPGAVQVFGVAGALHQWFHTGPWQDDFKSLVDAEVRKRAKQALEPTNVLARYKRLEVPET